MIQPIRDDCNGFGHGAGILDEIRRKLRPVPPRKGGIEHLTAAQQQGAFRRRVVLSAQPQAQVGRGAANIQIQIPAPGVHLAAGKEIPAVRLIFQRVQHRREPSAQRHSRFLGHLPGKPPHHFQISFLTIGRQRAGHTDSPA